MIHVVKDCLHNFPSLRLALDISHWICVSESYLEDQQEAIDLSIQHTVHLHARVGHREGLQVTCFMKDLLRTRYCQLNHELQIARHGGLFS